MRAGGRESLGWHACALAWAALFLLPTGAARADWVATSSVSETSTLPGLIHRHLELKDTETGDFSALDLALFPTSSKRTLRLIDNPNGTMDLADAAPDHGVSAGVNGGYFDPDFAPIGLRVKTRDARKSCTNSDREIPAAGELFRDCRRVGRQLRAQAPL